MNKDTVSKRIVCIVFLLLLINPVTIMADSAKEPYIVNFDNTDDTEVTEADLAPGDEFNDGTYTYRVNEDANTITLTGLANVYNVIEDPNIPSTVNGKTLTAIDTDVFCTNPTIITGNLTLPNSLKTLGNSVFEGCINLTGNLTLPNKIMSIGDNAFDGCSGFTGSLTIPNSVTSIGDNAFNGCSGLTDSLTIPSSVTYIGYYAFDGCSSITKVINNTINPCDAEWFIAYRSDEYFISDTGEKITTNGVLEKGAFTKHVDIRNITLNLTSVYINVGESITLEPIIEPSNASNKKVSWTSSDIDIATVSNGVVNGISPGLTSISANAEDLGLSGNTISASCTVHVEGKLDQIINAVDQTKKLGDAPFNLNATTSGDSVLSYKSSDTSVVTIDKNGLVTIKGVGTATITITASATEKYNAASRTVKITVTKKQKAEQTIIASDQTLTVGDPPFNLNAKTTGDGKLSFKSGDKRVATVDEDGFVTIIGSGTTTITITVSETERYKAATKVISIFVSPGVSPDPADIDNGSDNFYYGEYFEDDSGEYYIEIYGLNDSEKEIYNLVIPYAIDGKPVRRIRDEAFKNCNNLKGTLTIPNSVIYIGEEAFYNCNGFTGSLIIPDSVNHIGGCAFSYCKGFTGNLTIPDSVKYIGAEAFCDCSGFTGNLTISNGIKTIREGTFRDCSGFTGNLIIPDNVKNVGENAFLRCKGFTSVTIPYDVDTISEFAFFGCTRLKNVKIEGAVSIKNGAFLACTGLNGNLNLPKTLKKIAPFAFGDCYSITGLTIPSGIKNAKIDSEAFSGCYGIKKVTLKSPVYFDFDQLARDKKEYFKNKKTGKIVSDTQKKGTYIKIGFSKPYKTEKPSIDCVNDGLEITWEGQRGVSGYYVYRSTSGIKYKKIATVKSTTYFNDGADITSYYIDKNVKKGKKYFYKVRAYVTVGKKKSQGALSNPGEAYYLAAPTIISVNCTSPKSLIVKWKGSSNYSGYEIHCSRSDVFKDYKSVNIRTGKTTSKKISGLWSGRQCYVRIRALKKSGDKIYRSEWSEEVSVLVQ